MPAIGDNINPADPNPVQPETQDTVAVEVGGVPEDIRQQAIGVIYQQLDEQLGETMPGCGTPGKRPDDVSGRLINNSGLLYDAGLTTPDQVQAWMNSAWQHDLRLAAAAGVGKNIGYEAVMTGGAESFLGQLPESVLNDPATTAAVVGLIIATSDVVTGQILGSAAQASMYNGRCGMEKLPPSVPPPAHQTVTDAIRSSVLNMAKNLPRALVPPLMDMLQHRTDGTVRTSTADSIDTQVDGLGGIGVGIANEVLKLGPGPNYMARMMLRGDLDQILSESQQSWGAAAWDAAAGAAQGARDLVKSPVALGVIAYFAASVTGLLMANTAISNSGRAGYESKYNATLPLDSSPVGTLVAKRLDSVLQMGILSFGAPLLATGLQTAWEAMLDKGAELLTNWSMRRRPPSDAPGALEAGLGMQQRSGAPLQSGSAAGESAADQVAEQVAADAVAQGVQEAADQGVGILSSHCKTPTPPPAPEIHQRVSDFFSRGWRSAIRPLAPSGNQETTFDH